MRPRRPPVTVAPSVDHEARPRLSPGKRAVVQMIPPMATVAKKAFSLVNTIAAIEPAYAASQPRRPGF